MSRKYWFLKETIGFIKKLGSGWSMWEGGGLPGMGLETLVFLVILVSYQRFGASWIGFFGFFGFPQGFKAFGFGSISYFGSSPKLLPAP